MRAIWDDFGDWYQHYEIFTLQGLMTCVAMTKAQNAKSILEVACSSGRHSELIAKGFLRRGSRLVSCDFSKHMVEMMCDRYEHSEFKLVPNCRVITDLRDFVADSSLRPELPEPKPDEKVVFGCMADNMRLPFADASFDCYIANLSLMIVPDYKLQIKEAYRVLQPGSWACFAVWGRPERSLQFTLVDTAEKMLGREPTQTQFLSHFHI